MEKSLWRQHRHWLVGLAGLAVLALSLATAQAQVRFTNVAQLVSATIPAGMSGQQAIVSGRLTANDGGGGIFVYDSSSATSTNLGTIFKPNGTNGRWFRQRLPGELDLAWFGVDTTGVSANDSSIYSALTVLQSDGGGILSVPNGRIGVLGVDTGAFYRGIQLTNSNVRFVGRGKYKSSFVTLASNYPGNVFSVIGVSSLTNITFESVSFIGNGYAANGNFNGGRAFQNDTDITLTDWMFRDCSFSDFTVASFDNGSKTTLINYDKRITFDACEFECITSVGLVGVQFFSGEDLSIRNCYFSRIARPVSMEQANAGELISGFDVSNNTVVNSDTGTISASNSYIGVYVDSVGIIRDGVISGNRFLSNTNSTGTAADIFLSGQGGTTEGVVIADNISYGYSANGNTPLTSVRLNSVSGVTMIGNAFLNPVVATPTAILSSDSTNCVFISNLITSSTTNAWSTGIREIMSGVSTQRNHYNGNLSPTMTLDSTNTGSSYIFPSLSGELALNADVVYLRTKDTDGFVLTTNRATASQPIRIINGTASNPSLMFTSDDDGSGTGLYRVGSDSLGVSTAGSLAMVVTNRLVGIGTTSPLFSLHVVGAGLVDAYFGDGATWDTYVYDNTVNFGYYLNANAAGVVNYSGYNGGFSQFRDFQIGDGKGATFATFDGSDKDLSVDRNISVSTAGYGLRIKEGSNARMGTATLDGGSPGTVTVANTSVTANTRIFLTGNADGGTPGWVRVSARVAATSFTITSSANGDTSTVAWLLVEPSP